MKNPLSYQITEYDCGPSTMMNAISYLFKREDIPPDVVKYIMLYSLDVYNEKGEFGKMGTSGMAMLFLSNWLNQFGKVKSFPVHCEFLTGESVYIGQTSKLVAGIQQGGVAVVRLMYGCWHYVLLTGADERYIYLFDPYYRRQPFRIPGVELVHGHPARMNRKVAWDVLNSEGKGVYALGPIVTREATVIFNRDAQRTAADTIEYFI